MKKGEDVKLDQFTAAMKADVVDAYESGIGILAVMKKLKREDEEKWSGLTEYATRMILLTSGVVMRKGRPASTRSSG